MMTISRKLSEIAGKQGLVIETCAESIDLSEVGIQHGKCIDDKLISNPTFGKNASVKDFFK